VCTGRDTPSGVRREGPIAARGRRSFARAAAPHAGHGTRSAVVWTSNSSSPTASVAASTSNPASPNRAAYIFHAGTVSFPSFRHQNQASLCHRSQPSPDEEHSSRCTGTVPHRARACRKRARGQGHAGMSWAWTPLTVAIVLPPNLGVGQDFEPATAVVMARSGSTGAR